LDGWWLAVGGDQGAAPTARVLRGGGTDRTSVAGGRKTDRELASIFALLNGDSVMLIFDFFFFLIFDVFFFFFF
jgi:hypothetical protein